MKFHFMISRKVYFYVLKDTQSLREVIFLNIIGRSIWYWFLI